MKKKLKNKFQKAIFLNYKKQIKEVDSKMFLRLLDQCKKNNSNARYCLHKKKNDKQQEMIICQKQNLFFPPKKNTKSDQSFLILYGKLLIIIFDNKGRIISKTILSKNKKIFARVKKDSFHCDIPITPFSIHLETKNCIFNKNVNKIAEFNFDRKKILKRLNK